MTELTVDVGNEGVTPVDVAAHDAAVAEGAAEVQAGLAAGAAVEATEAAEIALQAAQANIETSAQVGDAVVVAQDAAATASLNAEMVLEALNAQTLAIAALTEELVASRKQAVPVKTSRPTRDREPGSSGPRLVRR